MYTIFDVYSQVNNNWFYFTGCLVHAFEPKSKTSSSGHLIYPFSYITGAFNLVLIRMRMIKMDVLLWVPNTEELKGKPAQLLC